MMTPQLVDNINNEKQLLFCTLKLTGTVAVVGNNLHIMNKRHSQSKSNRFLALL